MRIAALRQNRAFGIAVSLATYAVALSVAVLVVRLARVSHPLAVVALGDVAATVTVFLASRAADNSSLYDPYWSVKPAVVAGYYLSLAWPAPGSSLIAVCAVVAVYAVRLTSNFYRDWPGLAKEDFRYVGFRRRFPRAYWLVSFLGIHLFPTIQVYLGCLPLYAVAKANGGLNAVSVLGVGVALSAILLACVADEQLRRFRSQPHAVGLPLGEGLWRFSRHPNYLGEIMFWWGLYLCGLAGGVQWWWTGIGAVCITLMFVWVSVPMMESRLLSTRPGYAEYAQRTPMLLPVGSRSRVSPRPECRGAAED